ncbi:MAG: zf-HC2 domain-containing protein [Clostridiales bacterium]
MLNKNHLKNSLLIEILNNQISNDNKKVQIKKHLYSDNCTICLDKINSLKKFNALLNYYLENKSLKTANKDVCPYSFEIESYLSNEMTKNEINEFQKHLEICDDCRNLISYFVKSKLKLVDKKNNPENKITWKSTKKDTYVLENFITSFLQGIDNIALVEKTVYRTVKENKKIEYQKIILPQNDGIVNLTLFPDNDKLSLEIKILNSVDTNRIDIFTNNNILDSIDGNFIIFQIPDEEFKILINEKYEIT